MGGLKIFLIILAVLLTASGVCFLIYSVLKSKKKNTLLSRSQLSRKTIFEYLRTEFFSKNVFCGYLFPYPKNSHGFVSKYAPIDAVVITAGGVAVIDIQNFDCAVDNASGDQWAVRKNDRILEITSPIKENEIYKKVIHDLLRAGGVHNVPIYSLIVYTGNAKFTASYDNLISSRELIQVLSSLHTEKILTLADSFAIRKILNTNKKTKSEADAYLKKIYG